MQRRAVQKPEVPLDRTARHRILGAAREQFLAHGFHGVTMDDLAQGLGMSKKTIYAHFPSKTALMEAMLLDKFRCAEEELEAITSECSADFPTGLHRLLACVQRHTEDIRPPFLRDMQREAPDLFKVVHYSETYNENGNARAAFYVQSGMLMHYIYDHQLLPRAAVYFEQSGRSTPVLKTRFNRRLPSAPLNSITRSKTTSPQADSASTQFPPLPRSRKRTTPCGR